MDIREEEANSSNDAYTTADEATDVEPVATGEAKVTPEESLDIPLGEESNLVPTNEESEMMSEDGLSETSESVYTEEEANACQPTWIADLLYARLLSM